jgi:hypothetical protein
MATNCEVNYIILDGLFSQLLSMFIAAEYKFMKFQQNIFPLREIVFA